MARFRSILTVVFTVALAFLLISSHPAAAARSSSPSPYTAAQLEQIQRYAADVDELRDRILELPTLIQQQKWVDVKSLIHGPLGELRARMSRLSRSLDPKAQKTAQKAAKEVFEHLEAIDEAATSRNPTKAFRDYNEVLKELDTFFSLLPS
jgi:photosystem II protein PsbQ